MIRKLITTLLVILIPILSTFAIGLYGYKRYQDQFLVQDEPKGYFDTRIEEGNTLSEIKAYLDFYTAYYKEIVSTEVKNAQNYSLFTLKGYATVGVEYDENGEITNKTLVYMFFAYDIDYGMLYKEIFKSEQNNKLGAFIPTLSVDFIDRDTEGTDDELKTVANMSALSIVNLVDNNWVGYTREDGTKTKRNASGNAIVFSDSNSSTALVKVASFVPNKEYSSNLDLEFKTTDSEHSSDEASTVTIGRVSLSNVVQKAKNFDLEGEGIVKAYDEDIFEAGYFKYALARFIWWECLIAFVLTLLLMVVIVVVWTADSQEEKKNKK